MLMGEPQSFADRVEDYANRYLATADTEPDTALLERLGQPDSPYARYLVAEREYQRAADVREWIERELATATDAAGRAELARDTALMELRDHLRYGSTEDDHAAS